MPPKKPERTGMDTFKLYLSKPYIQVIPVVIFLVLLALALFYYQLYQAELKKIAEKYRAVTRIRNFMAQYNESFSDQNETEAIKGVELILDEMARLQATKEEVQKSIDEVIQKITDHWLPFKGHLYYFDDRVITFNDAKKECETQSAFVVYIKSPEEEDFLEAEINKRDSAYWIGLIKHFVWDWISGDRLTHKFWHPNPGWLLSSNRKVCAYIGKCTEKRKCWKEEYCDQKKKFICKWKGDTRWM